MVVEAELAARLMKPRLSNVPYRSNILEFGLPAAPLADDLLPTVAKRTRIWEFQNHLHCSIIGTCLSTAELRQLLVKLKLAPRAASDHHLHQVGVLLAGRRDAAAKLLNKALDQRHRLVIRRFDAATTEDGVRALWQACLREGEIPGGYWAALSHPATLSGLIRDVFADVHMLSHLVGAANRADIRRLAELEAERTALQDKVARQQATLHEAIVSRDERIKLLSAALGRRLGEERAKPAGEGEGDAAALAGLVRDLERRRDQDGRRLSSLEGQLRTCRTTLAQERGHRASAETATQRLQQEVEAMERMLSPAATPDRPDITGPHITGPDASGPGELAGTCVLYVGGRTGQVPALRGIAERLGARFLHHDGGLEERSGLLPGLVAQADLVLFPTDCVSHEAMSMAKRLCRQAEKPYAPLHSGGLGAFVTALSRCRAETVRAH